MTDREILDLAMRVRRVALRELAQRLNGEVATMRGSSVLLDGREVAKVTTHVMLASEDAHPRLRFRVRGEHGPDDIDPSIALTTPFFKGEEFDVFLECLWTMVVHVALWNWEGGDPDSTLLDEPEKQTTISEESSDWRPPAKSLRDSGFRLLPLADGIRLFAGENAVADVNRADRYPCLVVVPGADAVQVNTWKDLRSVLGIA